MENYIYQVKNISTAEEYIQAVDEGYVCIVGTKAIVGDAFRELETKSNQKEKNFDYVTEYACMLLEGKGCAKDEEKAVPLLMDLVDVDNNYKAFAALGKCYEKGIGMKKDIDEAVNWYSRAAEAGYAPAQYAIGVCFEEGTGLEESTEEALNWFAAAAEQGYGPAELRVAEYFEEGIGIEIDNEQAFVWFKDAADQDIVKAQIKVGEKLMNGIGVEKNEAEGFKWYERAANSGDWEAFCIVADCYFEGKGVEKNESIAVEMYRKAASREYAKAQYKLGMCYLNGSEGNVTQDIGTAINYLRLAADQDDVFALSELDRLITELKSQERCIHCGGEIKGVFHKCVKCGIKKDY